jgi:hypothetical protein
VSQTPEDPTYEKEDSLDFSPTPSYSTPRQFGEQGMESMQGRFMFPAHVERMQNAQEPYPRPRQFGPGFKWT